MTSRVRVLGWPASDWFNIWWQMLPVVGIVPILIQKLELEQLFGKWEISKTLYQQIKQLGRSLTKKMKLG